MLWENGNLLGLSESRSLKGWPCGDDAQNSLELNLSEILASVEKCLLFINLITFNVV